MRAVLVLVVVTACAPPVRVPATRIGPLAAGLHEFRRGRVTYVYDVRGRGPSCITSEAPSPARERRFTVVYFGSPQAPQHSHRRAVRAHVGLPLPDCEDREEASSPAAPPRRATRSTSRR